MSKYSQRQSLPVQNDLPANRDAAVAIGLMAVILIAVATLASDVSVAKERIMTKGPIAGGPGGGHFEEVCPHGSYLFGISARAGSWIDQVRLMCAPYAPGPRLDNMTVSSIAHGGGGGNEQHAHCQPGNFIYYLRLHYTHGNGLVRQYVDTIQVGCPGHADYPPEVCITSGEACWPGYSTAKNPSDLLQCNAGSAPIGLHGRSGKFVDALGLICGPFPPSDADRPAPPDPKFMDDVDLLGSDFSNHIARNPGVCMQACNSNPECRAWTFVHKGSRCFLKNAVPAASANTCCVSGVKAAADAAPPSSAPPAAPQRPIKRMGRGSKPLTKEECDAEGSLWVAQKERCIGKALLSALRAACAKKGADYSFDPQTAECIGPQGGGQQGGGQNFCTVKRPGTVYDRPGGDEIGELAAPTEGVTLLGKEGTDWYHVKWPAGEGWVYSGPGYEGAIACP